ncbi:MAG: hypothetical protein ACI4AQ_06235 [Lachnospiraceae bacterium]
MRIGNIGGYGGIAVSPYNYSVRNQSDVSDAYIESVDEIGKMNASEDIGIVQPVRYPNAKAQPVDPVKRMQDAQKVNQEYNQVAANFKGNDTWYGADALSGGYQTVGGTIDLFA